MVNPIYFISGHSDLTQKEFIKYYVPKIKDAMKYCPDCHFVLGDAKGCDTLANEFLRVLGANAIIYHRYKYPKNNPGNFPTVGGFQSKSNCNKMMTSVSSHDILWIRKGKEKSSVAKNRKRRQIFNKGGVVENGDPPGRLTSVSSHDIL